MLAVAVVGAVIAGLALAVSVFVFFSQRSLTERQVAIEEEVRSDRKAAALVADVRVRELRLVVASGAGRSDRVRLTVQNRGPAVATNIDAAIKESEDRRKSAGLGELVEHLDEVGGYSGDSPIGYYAIPRQEHRPPPCERLATDEHFDFEFWHRYRFVGDVGILLTWKDERGPQSSKSFTRLVIPE